MKETVKELTPMMKQWQSCKKDAGSALLLFRLGDFYECFFDDAKLLADTLMITLTKRGEIPMAGIPARSLETYIEKLIGCGLSVALAEQTQNPAETTTLVERKIKRVITPATFTSKVDENTGTNNFLLSISHLNKSYAISYTDTSTSEFFFSSFSTSGEMVEEILRISPKEILVSAAFFSKEKSFIDNITSLIKTRVNPIDPFYFDHKASIDRLHKCLNVASLDGFGLKGETAAINACGALIIYLTNHLFLDVSFLKNLVKRDTAACLSIDHSALAHLEIFFSPSGKSLFEVINFTKTPMGERLLKNSLLYPLICKEQIIKRQNCIKELLEKDVDLSSSLSGIKDVERLMTKIAEGRANPNDLFLLAISLNKISSIIKDLHGTLAPFISSLPKLPLVDAILQTIVIDDSEYYIAPSINAELDRLKSLEKGSSAHLQAYEDRLCEELDIKTLKVGVSRSFGYYIEVSKKSIHLVPQTFIRKQTVVNGERFVTQELQKLESAILLAKDGALKLEKEIFEDLVNLCIGHQRDILKASSLIAKIDLIHSLKTVALSRGYICPTISEGSEIAITEGAHPVLLKMMKQERFIPNDIFLSDEMSLAVLTGPNMAGKSTYIKSVALLVLLTQIGSFIPAKRASIAIVDKIFTRIGAMDDLGRGQSTFMVEMSETACILRNATKKSLIILDEIGRGTSTYDGIALAKSIATYIAKEVGAKTLFATHYLELTDLADTIPTIKNIRSTAFEKDETITFLHKIEEGKADQSYGIFVGKLAGLPRRVILDATEHLKNLSMKKTSFPSSPLKKTAPAQYTLFSEEEKEPLKKELDALDLNNMTPFQALEKLIQWQKNPH